MAQELPIYDNGAHQGCGCSSACDYEFDIRTIPHPIRHGAVLGALASLEVNAAIVLIAPHDPKPLLEEAAEIFGNAIEVSYLGRERGRVSLRLVKTRLPD